MILFDNKDYQIDQVHYSILPSFNLKLFFGKDVKKK